MSKQTDTLENAIIKGNLSVIANSDPQDYGPGNIECIGTVFADDILENTQGIGVNIEDILIKDGNVEVLNSTVASTSTTTGAITTSGGIGISNTTDATSQDNGGTITTAGGVAIKKKAYVGDSIYIDNFTGIGTVQPRKRLTVFDSTGNGELAIVSGDQNDSSILYLGTPQAAQGVSGAYKAAIIAQGANSNSRSNLRFCLNSSTGNTSASDVSLSDVKMSLLDNGFLGIGTDSPARLFHVQGNQGIWRLDRDANTVGLQLHRFPSGNFTTPWKGFLIGVNASGNNNGEFLIADYGTSVTGASSTRLLINNAGNIGINTPNPTSRLTVTGTGNITGNTLLGANLTVSGITQLNNYYQTLNITAPGNPPTNNIRFYTDTTDSLLKSKNSSGTITTYQPTTTKGDLLSHNGTTQVRVPVGSLNSVLLSDSSQSSGLRWGGLNNVSRTLNFAVSNKNVIFTDYTHISSIIYEGSTVSGLFSEFRVSSFKNSTNTYTYSIRIWDSINKQVICEITGLNNEDYQINTTQTINNLPPSSTILECQCKISAIDHFGVIINSIGLVYS